MSNICDALKILYPKGKAFQWIFGSNADNINKSLCGEPERIKSYFESIRNAGIPGLIPNEFLSDWENFLGLDPDSTLTNIQRQDRIKGRYVSVGGQGKDYIQQVLQSAGFPVYIFENNPDSGAKDFIAVYNEIEYGFNTYGQYSNRIDPREITGTLIAGSPDYSLDRVYDIFYGEDYYGEYDYGAYVGDYIVETNYTIPAVAERFIFFWFICGKNGLNNFVDIPKERKNDFIKLILQIKPAHTWCIAQINWI